MPTESTPSTSNMQLAGLIAATVAPFFWAIAVVLYRRLGRIMPPITLNLSKGLVASVVIGGVVLFDWLALGNLPWSTSWQMLLLMAVSGMVGLGLGDTLLFAGLNRMGARRMLLLFTTNPVLTVIAAWVLLGVPITVWQGVGIALTCGGVAWVIAERNSGKSDGHVDVLGVIFGLGAACCQAAGLLTSRYIFDRLEDSATEHMTAVASAWIRLLAGAAVLCLVLPLDKLLSDPGGEEHHHPRRPTKGQAALMFGVATFLGTVMGIWLMQIAVKESGNVGVASTLLSTSPLFVLPIAAILGERVSPRAILGATVTIVGVALLYIFSV